MDNCYIWQYKHCIDFKTVWQKEKMIIKIKFPILSQLFSKVVWRRRDVIRLPYGKGLYKIIIVHDYAKQLSS